MDAPAKVLPRDPAPTPKDSTNTGSDEGRSTLVFCDKAIETHGGTAGVGRTGRGRSVWSELPLDTEADGS